MSRANPPSAQGSSSWLGCSSWPLIPFLPPRTQPPGIQLWPGPLCFERVQFSTVVQSYSVLLKTCGESVKNYDLRGEDSFRLSLLYKSGPSRKHVEHGIDCTPRRHLLLKPHFPSDFYLRWSRAKIPVLDFWLCARIHLFPHPSNQCPGSPGQNGSVYPALVEGWGAGRREVGHGGLYEGRLVPAGQPTVRCDAPWPKELSRVGYAVPSVVPSSTCAATLVR